MGKEDIKMIVFNHELKKLGLINSFSMIKYTRYGKSVGSFELKCTREKDNTSILKNGNILWIEKTIAGIVQYVYSETKNGGSMTVKGKLINTIFDWRTIYPMFEANDYPENIVIAIVNTYCKTDRRDFPLLVVESDGIISDTKIKYQKTGGTVADELETLCKTYNMCYDVELIIQDDKITGEATRKFRFYLYHGKDRRFGNGVNKSVLIGTDFNNVKDSEYSLDATQYRNYAYVAGEGEGTARKYTQIYNGESEPSGFDRKEVFIDARDLQQSENATFSAEEDYISLLQHRGKEKLDSDYVITESYEAEARADEETEYIIERDYFVGDKITVIDDDLSLKVDTTVTGETVTLFSDGYTIEPIFGYEMPTVYERIKKGVL